MKQALSRGKEKVQGGECVVVAGRGGGVGGGWGWW